MLWGNSCWKTRKWTSTGLFWWLEAVDSCAFVFHISVHLSWNNITNLAFSLINLTVVPLLVIKTRTCKENLCTGETEVNNKGTSVSNSSYLLRNKHNLISEKVFIVKNKRTNITLAYLINHPGVSTGWVTVHKSWSSGFSPGIYFKILWQAENWAHKHMEPNAQMSVKV